MAGRSGVAYRLVMDHHRVGRRVRDLVGWLTEARPKSALFDVDDALSLWPVVDRLPARERAVLYLRYRADLSFEQIGEVMGITTASARTYASRATDRLRGLLEGAEETEMHSDEIERRLRLPAHDEPSFLPPLLLPQASGFELTGGRVRAGSAGGSCACSRRGSCSHSSRCWRPWLLRRSVVRSASTGCRTRSGRYLPSRRTACRSTIRTAGTS